MCACVYVGGVARLLLDPRPPMRERETPPPSWGGHHRRRVVGCLGGRNSYELVLVSHWVLIIAICCKVKVRGPKTSASGAYRHTQALLGHAINAPHISL